MPRVTGLFIYPVKSLRGIALASCALGPRGLEGDRAFMVTRPDGAFVTQRELPAMATVSTALADEYLKLSVDGRGPLILPKDRWFSRQRVRVRVWDDECEAVDQGDVAASWLKAALGEDVRLVAMPPETVRPTRRREPGTDATVGFADGYPLLVASEESLAELNRRLASPVPMDRFRANVVVAGCDKPHDEDEWHTFTIGALPFRGVKRCARCAITATDQRTGDRGKEPLKTLATYRRDGKEALFGMNANHLAHGTLRVGDEVAIIRREVPPL